jgi:alkanesulfonate monooxygenase SsuD/methylene tetrahydromethanopterin reductase-like flavin-dependent oxidoreductase (luciferase family)
MTTPTCSGQLEDPQFIAGPPNGKAAATQALPRPLDEFAGLAHSAGCAAIDAPGGRTELDAADRGMGALILSIADVERNIPRFAAYRERIRRCEPVGAFVNDQIAVANWLFCHEDRDYAWKRGEEMVATFGYMAGQTVEISEAYPASNYTAIGLLGTLRPDPHAPDQQKPLASGLCFGDPAQLIETVARWEAAGADHLVFMIQARETVRQQEVMDSLRLFAREVMPHFSGHKPVRAAAGAR